MMKDDVKLFGEKVKQYSLDFEKLVYIIFPFGQQGHELENKAPYEWQLEEWRLMSQHFKNPATYDKPYKLLISSGNGAAKTAFGTMTMLMLLYTKKLRGRVTANTHTQLSTIVWTEIDVWCGRARFFDVFFDKLGESIKSRDEKLAENWRFDKFTWDAGNPAAVSGLHNAGNAILYWFEEASGIPDVIWKYANGAMTDTDTMKVWLGFANSDDPDSAFEQRMISPDWRGLRIDTRRLDHVSKDFVATLLAECGGNEDADDFRVRVRGLPRKTAADAIIGASEVETAIANPVELDSQSMLPCVMTADLAWTGGDYCCIWIHQGAVSIMVDYYKLDKAGGQTHLYTYQRMLYWEREYSVDYVLIDQAEGTAVFTMAQAANKYNWELVSFASSPNDVAETKDSQYHNMRAQMYYEAQKWLQRGGALKVRNPDWIHDVKKQLCWTKGVRNKTTLKKQAEPKIDIKQRVGMSPDVADGFVLRFSRTFYDRLEHNQSQEMRDVQELSTDSTAYDPYAGLTYGR